MDANKKMAELTSPLSYGPFSLLPVRLMIVEDAATSRCC
jgi:hypothetical protein